ncbi:MAG: hypothetical protein Q8Q08_01370 [Candidatus Omnitrophota bacterium]|nr:hypothetical protein [Candidatus Omnitrophota bacterium]
MILILFIFAGLTAFEKYSSDHGRQGPVSRLMDFAGLGKFAPRERADQTRQTFLSDSSQALSRLSTRHHEIQDQRADLISHRRELLDNLKITHDDIVKAARAFRQAVDEERLAFLERFPELDAIAGDLSAAHRNPDPALREQAYLQAKEDLVSFLTGILPDPEQNIPQLGDRLEKIGALTSDIPGALEDCQEFDPCLEHQFGLVREDLKSFQDRALVQERRRSDGVESSSRGADAEWQAFIRHFDATLGELETNDESMEGELKQVAEQLVSRSDADLRVLMQRYQDLVREQGMLLDNLELAVKRLRDNQSAASRQVRELDLDAESSWERLNVFRKEYLQGFQQRASLLQELQELTDEIQGVTRGPMDNTSQALDKILQGVAPDIAPPASAAGGEAAGASSARTPPPRPSLQAAVPGTASGAVQDRMGKSRVQKINDRSQENNLHRSAQEQYRRLRDHAADSGH